MGRKKSGYKVGMYDGCYDKETDKTIEVCLNCKNARCKSGECPEVKRVKGIKSVIKPVFEGGIEK